MNFLDYSVSLKRKLFYHFLHITHLNDSTNFEYFKYLSQSWLSKKFPKKRILHATLIENSDPTIIHVLN